MNPVSTVGIRASWTCATCKGTATVHQITFAASKAPVEMPTGWVLVDRATYCGALCVPIEEAAA